MSPPPCTQAWTGRGLLHQTWGACSSSNTWRQRRKEKLQIRFSRNGYYDKSASFFGGSINQTKIVGLFVGERFSSRVPSIHGSAFFWEETWFHHCQEKAWYSGGSQEANEGINVFVMFFWNISSSSLFLWLLISGFRIELFHLIAI